MNRLSGKIGTDNLRLDVRLRRIRSLKTMALNARPPAVLRVKAAPADAAEQCSDATDATTLRTEINSDI
jgi:hypothetical protein